jgi:hypothetical protein
MSVHARLIASSDVEGANAHDPQGFQETPDAAAVRDWQLRSGGHGGR